MPEYKIKYEWQEVNHLWADSYVRVFDAVQSGEYHSQKEIARAAGLKDEKYAGKILHRLRSLGLIDKVWVVKEDENVDL